MNKNPMSSESSRRVPAVFVLLIAAGVLFGWTSAARAQSQPSGTQFASPEEAIKALLEATKSKDKEALERIFGPAVKDLVSGDEVSDAAEVQEFAAALAAAHEFVREGDDKVIVAIGKQKHPFAIPIVRRDGKWSFDTEAGKEEVLNRRVGENELGAIRVCRGIVSAQFEYFSEDRDGDHVLEYAQRLASTAGQKDGLFWETKPDAPLSPLGPLIAQARADGYSRKSGPDGDKPQPYQGYVYKTLTRQGERAPGGKHDYVINGNMVAGFALVAYPVDYGASGVMTFVVNSNGKVQQKDLGEKTAELAGAMDAYDADASWTLVKD